MLFRSRELRNCLERAAALSTGDLIEADQMLPADGGAGAPVTTTSMLQAPSVTLEELEREHILRVLDQSEGNRERAAAILGISSRTLYRKLREYETHVNPTDLATEG